jgi:hypothetical protein
MPRLYNFCSCFASAIFFVLLPKFFSPTAMVNTPDFFSLSPHETSTSPDFIRLALDTFCRQARECEPYARYLSLLGVQVGEVQSVAQIPFLPIEFFRSERIACGSGQAQAVFTSSGTTGADTSHHHVLNLPLYEESLLRGFELFYGSPSRYCILALLPGYAERQGSSLVYMVQKLLEKSGHPMGGFFLHNHRELAARLALLATQHQPTLLVGVSFALLDFVEELERGELPPLAENEQLVVMETGGMKGRRRELPRDELHSLLRRGFGVDYIHSEYGMTELLSQAYSKGDGVFFSPPWMRVLLRDLHNPFAPAADGALGGINVVDLANQHSCSFIETQDVGRAFAHGGFAVLGRVDYSLARGCNTMI